jgi:hypothetical protein
MKEKITYPGNPQSLQVFRQFGPTPDSVLTGSSSVAYCGIARRETRASVNP